MKSIAKADATVRELKSSLEIRAKAGQMTMDTVRLYKDAQGWPMLVLSVAGNEAAEQPVIAIRVKAVDAVSKDIFGNDLVAFAPHTIEIASEAGAVSRKDLAIADIEVGKVGMKVLVKEIVAETAVTETSMNAAAPVAEIDWLQFPTKLG